MKFIETSAKNALNVEEAFTTMTREIININMKKKNLEKENDRRKNLVNIKDTSQNIGKSDKKGCC